MAITLKQAFALNGTPDLTSFKDLQEQVKNPNYFNDNNPINHLSSWDGYYYSSGYNIASSLSTSSVAASGGEITVTYTIKQSVSSGEVVVSGVTPTVTSTIGTVSNITATNSSGVGTAKVTVGSLGSTVKSETTGTISVTYSGSSKDVTFKRGANAANAYYKSLVISLSYAATSPSTSYKTVSPSLTVKATPYYTSGTAGSQTTIPSSGYTVSYTESTTSSYASINTSTGIITWNSNAKVTSDRTVGSTVSVKCNSSYSSLSGSKAVTATHTKDSIKTYGDVSVSIGSGITARNGSATVTGSQTLTWNSGASDAGTISYAITNQYIGTGSASISGTSITRFSLNGTTLSHTTMGEDTGYDIVVVTATGQGGKTETAKTYVQNKYSDSGGTTSTTYGTWGGGTISFNSSAELSAAADSRTVTIQPWSRTKTVSTTAKIREWTSGSKKTLSEASSNNSTEYYTGTVSVSENGTYTSLSSTSYTASSSAKTLTLTKSTCGSTPTASTTVTITADPTISGPSTTTASISQQANQKDYNQTVLSLYHVIETTNLPAEADYTRVYMEGEVQKCYTSGAGCSTTTQTWAVDNVTSNVSWITFNSTDGTIRWDENTTSSERRATLTIKYGSYSRTETVVQAAGATEPMLIINTPYYYSSNPGDWTITFKYYGTVYATATASMAEYSSTGTQSVGVQVPSSILNDTSSKTYDVIVSFGTGSESWSGSLTSSNRSRLSSGYDVTINAY